MVNQVFYRGMSLTRADVLNAFRYFDANERSGFSDFKRWAIEYDGKPYPPKQILRIALECGFDEVTGGGTEINSRFQSLGFKIIELSSSANSATKLHRTGADDFL